MINMLNAVWFISLAQIRFKDATLKFMWTLGNRCPQLCEVRANSYVETEQY